jgi:hypothetical protein
MRHEESERRSFSIEIISTGVTLVFRRANLTAEQKIPNSL